MLSLCKILGHKNIRIQTGYYYYWEGFWSVWYDEYTNHCKRCLQDEYEAVFDKRIFD